MDGTRRRCELCGDLLPAQDGVGRHLRYCPPPRGCKQAAYRARLAARHAQGDGESGGSVLRNDTLVLRNDERARRPLKPILKYPGAKWRLAPWIISHFPPHVHYVEAYVGSGACFFLKEPSTHEVLNDLNASVVNLFRVLRERGEELAKAIALTPWAEDEYLLVERDCTDGDELEHARRFLIRCWQAHGGTLYQVAGWKHNGLNGHAYPARLWRHLPDRLRAVINRLKDAEIRNIPALACIDYYNAPDVLHYVDPPYVLATRARKYYPYEMTEGDHLDLLELLDRHKGSIVLSGYAHPLYDERLKLWQRIELPTVGEHGKRQTEVLWINKHAARLQQLSLFAV